MAEFNVRTSRLNKWNCQSRSCLDAAFVRLIDWLVDWFCASFLSLAFGSLTLLMFFWSFRTLLDFDFEKLCSVSLSHLNVYACLVCGKYFQGRGTNTHAYTHSVEQSHHVFLNLTSLRFYCLPDGYEIIDQSLEDITVRTEHVHAMTSQTNQTNENARFRSTTHSINQSINRLAVVLA